MARALRPAYVAGAFTALALVSAAVGGARVWDDMTEARREYRALTDEQVEHAPAVHERLPVRVFRFYRTQVRSTDRYYFNAPPGAPAGLVNRGIVAKTFATYWLLPALPVAHPSSASTVLSYGAPLPRLERRYATVVEFPGDDAFSVGRLAR